MLRHAVASKFIKSIGYDPRPPLLEVELKNGEVYQYLGVQQYLYTGLKQSNSIDEYFEAFVKKGGFPYVKV